MGDKFVNSSAQMCGFYSITSDRKYDKTASALRYFIKPLQFPLDLNVDLSKIKPKPESYYEEKMDSILTYIVKNKADFINPNSKTKNLPLIPSTKYITYRGVIRMVMSSLYEKRKAWCILATKYKGNIYLCQHSALEDIRNEPEWLKRLSYFGPKFEQHCLTEDPSKMPDLSEPVDACVQFFVVVKRMLVGRNFLFAGEMDGIVSDKRIKLKKNNLENLKFVELKVAADPSQNKHKIEEFKKVKCQNVWAQSFLTGVEDIYFGMRDNKGIVSKIEHYHTKMIPHICQNYWTPSKCFEFLDFFLNYVESKMKRINCPNTTFEFNFDPSTQNITCNKHPGKTELSLLPDWYVQAFQR